MLLITPGLIICILGTWTSGQVRACKNKKPTTPPPLVCTYGDTFEDSDYEINQNQTKKDANIEVPSTVYVEVMVAFDENLYNKIGKSYYRGKWKKTSSARVRDSEVYLYARKFMSAVNIKFQGQFKTPKIKFILREALKI